MASDLAEVVLEAQRRWLPQDDVVQVRPRWNTWVQKPSGGGGRALRPDRLLVRRASLVVDVDTDDDDDDDDDDGDLVNGGPPGATSEAAPSIDLLDDDRSASAALWSVFTRAHHDKTTIDLVEWSRFHVRLLKVMTPDFDVDDARQDMPSEDARALETVIDRDRFHWLLMRLVGVCLGATSPAPAQHHAFLEALLGLITTLSPSGFDSSQATRRWCPLHQIRAGALHVRLDQIRCTAATMADVPAHPPHVASPLIAIKPKRLPDDGASSRATAWDPLTTSCPDAQEGYRMTSASSSSSRAFSNQLDRLLRKKQEQTSSPSAAQADRKPARQVVVIPGLGGGDDVVAGAPAQDRPPACDSARTPEAAPEEPAAPAGTPAMIRRAPPATTTIPPGRPRRTPARSSTGAGDDANPLRVICSRPFLPMEAPVVVPSSPVPTVVRAQHPVVISRKAPFDDDAASGSRGRLPRFSSGTTGRVTRRGSVKAAADAPEWVRRIKVAGQPAGSCPSWQATVGIARARAGRLASERALRIMEHVAAKPDPSTTTTTRPAPLHALLSELPFQARSAALAE